MFLMQSILTINILLHDRQTIKAGLLLSSGTSQEHGFRVPAIVAVNPRKRNTKEVLSSGGKIHAENNGACHFKVNNSKQIVNSLLNNLQYLLRSNYLNQSTGGSKHIIFVAWFSVLRCSTNGTYSHL